MDWAYVAKNWNTVKASAKAKWPSLTDDDIKSLNGTRGSLQAMISLREGISPDEAREALNDWFKAEGYDKKANEPAKSYPDPAPETEPETGTWYPDATAKTY